jgi:glycosyltransferase involved in cell wall biosynthesis
MDEFLKIVMYLPSYGKGGAATTQHWTELAEHLAQINEVHVVTASGPFPSGTEKLNGVFIRRLGGNFFTRTANRHLREILMWFLMVADALFSSGKMDFAICVDTPRLSVFLGFLHRIRNGTRVLCWVKDLPLEQVVRRSSKQPIRFFAKVCNNISCFSLRLADRVIVIGECMRDVLHSRGVPYKMMTVIGDWAEDKGARKISPSLARAEAGLPELFTILYLGFAAPWHDFDALIEAMPKLLKEHPIQFVFVGNGPGIDRVADKCRLDSWKNVNIMGWIHREELQKIPHCGEIHLACLKYEMLGTCAPSKTYTSMECSRPVIFIGPKECQAARDLQNSQAGWVVENCGELIEVVEKILSSPGLHEQYGRCARVAFEAKHSTKVVFEKWEKLLETLIQD